MLSRIPIRWRIFLFHVLTMLAIGAALLIGLFAVFGIAVSETVEHLATSRANEAARIIESTGELSETALVSLNRDSVVIIALDETGMIVTQTGSGLPDGTHVDNDVWTTALATGVGQGSRNRRVFDSWDDSVLYLHVEPVAPNPSNIRLVGAAVSYDQIGQNQFSSVTFIFGGFGIVGFLLVTIGSWFLVRYSLAPVKAIATTASEISEADLSRRLPVRAQRDELGHLAATFNELLDRLELAFQHRESLLRHQRQFIADASHELRTPLTSILGYTRMLRSWGLENPGVSREAVDLMEQQAIRMQALVEGLLQLAREDEDVSPTNVAGISLNRTITEAIASLRASAPDVAIRADLPARDVQVVADGDQIRQVIDILLSNAVKYAPTGADLTVHLQEERADVVIAVIDTGPGIALDLQARIFERFYRVDASRTTRGAGLGLAIATSIAQKHGGTLTVESQPAAGSTFTLTLPREPAEPT